MSNMYFVGDPHLGHRNITKFRKQFNSVQEHDGFILDRILSTAGKKNTLFLMGDCFFTEEHIKSAREIRKGYRKINFILGNHDTDNPERRRVLKTLITEGLVDEVHSMLKYKEFWVTHCPMHPEELRGKKNIYAHTHSYTIQDDSLYQCVSLEQTDYRPIELSEIRERFNAAKKKRNKKYNFDFTFM